MKLVQRLQTALRTVWNDVFSEGDEPQRSSTGTQQTLGQILTEARDRLDALRVEWANVQARQRRIATERQEVLDQANALSAAADEALKAENEASARDKLAQLQRLQARAAELADLEQSFEQLNDLLQETVQSRQMQLERAQLKALELVERERNAAATEELLRQRSELRQQAADLRDSLSERQEEIARREDLLAARREVERRT
jgi:phage shock protein A